VLQDVVSHAISIYKNYSLATYRLIQRWYFDRWVVERGGRIVVSIITGRAHTHTYIHTPNEAHDTTLPANSIEFRRIRTRSSIQF